MFNEPVRPASDLTLATQSPYRGFNRARESKRPEKAFQEIDEYHILIETVAVINGAGNLDERIQVISSCEENEAK